MDNDELTWIFGERKTDKRKTNEEAREQSMLDMRSVLSTDAGRRFVWDLMDYAQVFRNSFTGQSNGTIFNEGRSSVGQYVMKRVAEASPDALADMMRSRLTKKEER